MHHDGPVMKGATICRILAQFYSCTKLTPQFCANCGWTKLKTSTSRGFRAISVLFFRNIPHKDRPKSKKFFRWGVNDTFDRA
jgi:hypothetical protein